MSWEELPFCAVRLDRAAHRRTDPEWLAKAWLHARIVVVTPDGSVLVEGEPPKLVYVDAIAAPPGERLFLAVVADVPYFAMIAEPAVSEGFRTATLRQVGGELSAFEAALLAEVVGLVNWLSTHRFSPLTGAPLVVQAAGWEAAAADGSGVVWPRTNPAVIVLVHDGVAGDAGRALLGRHPSWPVGRYSCLAGFVEPGESAEGAVHREVFEETGAVIRDVRYVASQPWPLPASLMLGFTALGDPEAPLRVDPVELEDARWFSRAELSEGGAVPPPLLPSRTSISSALVAQWRDG